MELLKIENEFRELLLQVFGLDSIDEIKPEQSLVEDLGAESLDFVEIIWMVEDVFGVILKTDDIVRGDSELEEAMFEQGRLTSFGATRLQGFYPDRAERIRVGMPKVAIFRLITVHDMAILIRDKLGEVSEPC